MVVPFVVGRGAMLMVGTLALLPAAASADEPIALVDTFAGALDFFATGAALAVDGPDAGTEVDMLSQPATVQVTAADVLEDADLRAAYLYWGGSIVDSDCDGSEIDDTVQLTPPGGDMQEIGAAECWCSLAGSMSYDVQMCRAEITSFVGDLVGEYTVDEFSPFVNNQSTHNASFSIVLVYQHPSLPPRRIALYDGLQTMSTDTTTEITVTLDGLTINDPALGDLTWYVLEGDLGGSSGEQVSVDGVPAGGTVVMQDAINPAGNPMNGTINTTTPVQPDSVGVDIDQFSIDDAIEPFDTAVDVTYSAGVDKWWIAYNVVGVDVFEPVLGDESSKTWALHDDVAGDGVPSPGDTVRYTIHLENTGNAGGAVVLSDDLSDPLVDSFELVDVGAGLDASVGDAIIVEEIGLDAGEATDIVFDVLIAADAVDGAQLLNIAEYEPTPGAAGQLFASPVVIGQEMGADTGGDDDDDDDDDDADETSAADDVGDDGTGAGPGGDASASGGTGDDSEGGSSGGSPGSASGLGTAGATEDRDEGCGCRRASTDLHPAALLLLVLARRRRLRAQAA